MCGEEISRLFAFKSAPNSQRKVGAGYLYSAPAKSWHGNSKRRKMARNLE